MPSRAEARALGDECTGEFFRIVIESLADAFDPEQAAIYEELMRAWISPALRAAPRTPESVDTVYVLSRVTLGADIKIVSPMLHGMRERFPGAHVVFVSNRKSAELFETDWLEADYPRGGSINDRIAFAHGLREKLATPNRIVIDPDSRMTQLGLIPVCEAERYFHFPSRIAGGERAANLSDLMREWLTTTFGVTGRAFISPKRVEMECERPFAAVSLGVGENESKRLGIDFEARIIGELASRFRSVWVDRGAGGVEAARVTNAVDLAGAAGRVRFWEGSFAGFASIISQSNFYVGYDSAGQHAAAAAGIPLVTIFAGAASARFRERWSPDSEGAHIINADGLSPDECLRTLATVMPGHL